MIPLPSREDKQWRQANNSDLFGNIAVTKNITFDRKGYLRLSDSSRAAISNATDADLDEAAVIVRSQDHGYWVLTHDQAFTIDENKILGIRPTQDATVGVPTGDIQSDATFSSGLLIATQDNDVDYYDPSSNAWTDTNIALTATTGSQHPIEKFTSLAGVAIGNVNTVLLYASPLTATPTLQVTLTILSDFYVTGLAYFNQNLYISTMNRSGGHAFMYVWNGYGTAAQSAYEVDSNIIYDVCMHDDSIYCFDGKGRLLRFNGAGFTQVDALPSFYTNTVMSDETNVNMMHNCMKSNGDVLYINVSTNANTNRNVNQPDGVWCYDSSLGFMYHRYGLSNALVDIDSILTTDVDTTTNQIVVTSAPITGTEVIFDTLSATPPTPLIDGTRYFAIKVDATHIKLATTKTNALAGTAIDITAQASGTTSLVIFPNYDYGQSLAPARSVAILPIEREVTKPQYGNDLIWGGSVYGTQNTAIDVLGTTTKAVENRGYFITPKIQATGITDKFNTISLKFSPFLSDTDTIVIKYRIVDDRIETIPVTGTRWLATWTSTTTFTTTETEFSTAAVGDEVEFLSGGGAGILAHITVISENAGTYTVTIDTAYDYYTSGDTARFVFRNWTKWVTISSGSADAERGYFTQQLGVTGKFLQLKIELRGVQTQIEELTVDNYYHLPTGR